MRATIVIVALLLAGCATTKAPDWLMLEPGWEEACQRHGCIPFTRAEINFLIEDVAKKAMALCQRSGI